MSTTLGIGLVGAGFVGSVHSQAWRVAPHFFDLPVAPRMRVLCDTDPRRAAWAAEKYGWAEHETDFHALLARPDVDLVDICVPGRLHAEVAIAALEAGKHVLCEKPLANSVAEAEAMQAAAARAAARGQVAMVGFSYRRAPAVALARTLIATGRLGEIRQVRVAYQQDWLTDPAAPLSWRLRKEDAGSGALGDLGAHAVDLACHLLDEPVSAVSGTLHTFVEERPLAAAGVGLGGRTSVEGTGRVTVDDAAWFLVRFASGAMGSFEATRFATGRKNSFTVEVSGEGGALVWNAEDLNVLQWYDAADDVDRKGYARVLVTEPEHPYSAAWWPTGHVLGWEHLFTHQVVELLAAVGAGGGGRPDFADGLALQRILAAVERSSAAAGAWCDVEPEPRP